MRVDVTETIGFVGIGAMGEPMALNLLKAGHRLSVWNRTRDKCGILAAAGAEIADTPSALFEACRVIFLMLADNVAMDAVLARGSADFARRVSGRTVISTATVSPNYSKALEADIVAAGGHYVEAPVSGSRKPAEAGQLVAMVASAPEAISRVAPLFAPLCRNVVECGAVPRALSMKFAVNIFLIASMTGLAESAHFAKAQGLDLNQWGAILNAGQMASDISRVKVGKLLAGDFSPQAAISNALESNRLITDAAEQSGLGLPLMEACLALFRRAEALGLAQSDMISVVSAFETGLPKA